MDDPYRDPENELKQRIEAHFIQETPAEIVKRSKELFTGDMAQQQYHSLVPYEPVFSESALAHPVSCRMRLRAYLACALTALASDQLAVIVNLSDRIDLACQAVDVDLYQPIKHTDPRKHADIPSAEVFKKDRERVVSSDILIHLCHFPSTGSGEELSFAYDALVPIILIAPGHQTVSRMITGIPSLKIEIKYRDVNDVPELVQEKLWEVRPYLEQRRLLMADFSENIVGEKVKELRLEQNLSREDLAQRVGLTIEGLANIEDSVDIVSNPSLTVLRSLATALKTTVAELVNPDYNETIISSIQTMVNEGAATAAARFRAISSRDRRALMRRYLIRVLDIIENRQTNE